jgi:hypothetical protein
VVVGDLVFYTEENSTEKIMAMIVEVFDDSGNVRLLLPSGKRRILSSIRISLLPKRGNYLKC